jgi:hypothetical protein
MKVQITFKDPDTLDECIKDAVENQEDIKSLPDDEKELLVDTRIGKIKEVCYKWFQWGEYVVIEVDTELKTARVMETKEID